MYLLQGARRLSGLIGHFDGPPRQSIADPDGTAARLIRGMATELHRCAASLASRDAGLPDPRSIETDNGVRRSCPSSLRPANRQR